MIEQPSVVLGAFPYYPNNPWQEIVYSDLRGQGAAIEVLGGLDSIAWVEQAVAVGRSPVVHVNWTAAVSQTAQDVAASLDRVDQALDGIRRAKEAGAAVVWSVHNVLPHDARFLVPELVLCRGLALLADVISVMNPITPDAVADWYILPGEKVSQLPLPSYRGWYPDTVSRADARDRLGIDDDETAILLFGVLRPYKGIEELLDAIPEVRRELPRIRLLVAGEVGPGYSEERLREIFGRATGVEIKIGFIPDSEVQWWMRAADAMVLPYRAGLNSGALFLAAGFGLPVIMSRSDAALEVAGSAWVHVLEPEERLSVGIVNGLRRFASGRAEEAALAEGARRAPEIVAAEFSRQVAEAISRRVR